MDPDGQGEAPLTPDRSVVRPSTMVAALGLTVVFCLLAAEGIRNLAPGDSPATHGAAQTEGGEEAAAFPRARPRTVSRAREESCAGRAGGPVATMAEPIGDRARWLTSIDYPLASLAAGDEGVSAVVLTIDRHGLATGCTVASGSGHAMLDAAACQTLQSRARFEPARDAMGCPTETVYRQRVRWQIPVD